jgi:hypothetical protein
MFAAAYGMDRSQVAVAENLAPSPPEANVGTAAGKRDRARKLGDRHQYLTTDESEPGHTPIHLGILEAAMERHGLNPAKVAVKIRPLLKRKKAALKGDRSTIYRIVKGKTLRPQPAIRNALIEVLELKGDDVLIVQRGLGGAGQKSSEKT